MKLDSWKGRGPMQDKKRESWLFVRGDKKGRPTFICDRCGDEYPMNVPVSIDVLVAAMKAWGQEHERCVPRAKPTEPTPARARPYLEHAIAESRRRTKRTPRAKR